MPSIIFHHPFPISSSGTSGSQVRVYEMRQAFRELGYDVESVAGYGAERGRKIRQLNSDIKKGRPFDFLYSESHTLPTLLTEPHHLPLYPRLDFALLRSLKKRLIPIGLFYRDVHWRFNQSEAIFPSPSKRFLAKALYHYDWVQYKRVVDHLFLPSLNMARHLPSAWFDDEITALPPGAKVNSEPSVTLRTPPFTLELFYVGGVTPPLYDLTPLFSFIQGITGLKLTLCCRPEEWQKVRSHYTFDANNITVVHASGKNLEPYYMQADVFCILWKAQPYLDFAMPVKVFEALSYGLPILTTAGTETARFVASEEVGWAVSSKEGFVQIVRHLQQHPDQLFDTRQRVLAKRNRHSWQVRAQSVADALARSSS